MKKGLKINLNIALTILIVIQISLFLILLLVGYKQGYTSTNFDNFINKTPLATVAGGKDYEATYNTSGYDLDPELASVYRSRSVYEYIGYIHSKSKEGNNLKVEVRKTDADPVNVIIVPAITAVCINDKCDDDLSIDTLTVGDRVAIYTVHEGVETKVAQNIYLNIVRDE